MVLDNVNCVLLFLEFFATNGLSFRVINNYMSVLKVYFESYSWSVGVLESHFVRHMMRGIRTSVQKNPTPMGLFSLHQIREISRLCGEFDNPMTYRVAFLLGFYGFLCIANVAPPSASGFLKEKHFLRSDVVFQFPGVQLHLKWAKNIQAPERVHMIKLPLIRDPVMCPTQSLSVLLKSHALPPSAPLLVLSDGSLLTQSLLRKRLATLLRMLNLHLLGFGYHTFRRSGATLAFDSNISLQNIKLHGAWQSEAVWSYISENTSQALQISLVFQQLANFLP